MRVVIQYSTIQYSTAQYYTVWVTEKFPVSVKPRLCNGHFVFRFRARFILHISVFIFYCVSKIILRTWNGEKTVKRTL